MQLGSEAYGHVVSWDGYAFREQGFGLWMLWEDGFHPPVDEGYDHRATRTVRDQLTHAPLQTTDLVLSALVVSPAQRGSLPNSPFDRRC